MAGGGKDVTGREGLGGLRWGGGAGIDQWISDVMADSFRGKLQGLASLVPGMPVFCFNFLDRHSRNMLLNTIVGRTLDSGDTSPPLTLSAPLQDFVHEVPLAAFLVACGGSRVV